MTYHRPHKRFGISLKTSVISAVIVFVILAGTSVFLVHVESRLVRDISDHHLNSIRLAIDSEGENQRQSLENKIITTTEIASEVLALYLYEIDQEWLTKALLPYMTIPEVQSVEVLDEYGESFAAVWRNHGIRKGVSIPPEIKQRGYDLVDRKSYYEGVFVGTIRIYYTRELLAEHLLKSKKEAELEAQTFQELLKDKKNRAFGFQLGTMVLVIVVLAATLSLYLRGAVILPVLRCVEFAGKISRGFFPNKLGFVKSDEIGQLASALDHMADNIKTTQVELTRAMEQAKHMSRLKSEFLANMSHELRTPLNSILLMSKLLWNNTDGALGNAEVTQAQTIHRSATELLEMINELLDLAKIEAGMMTIDPAPLMLDDLKRYIQITFDVMAMDQDLSFEVIVDHDAPETVVTDDKRLRQILRNLISNAFKFTETGGITLRVGRPDPTSHHSDTGLPFDRTTAFTVTDSGIGIPSDQLDLIFESFRQVDGTISRKYGGTGLGLSISRELAGLLKGELLVDSVEGEGSTFTLLIPDIFSDGDSAPEGTLVGEGHIPLERAVAPERFEAARKVHDRIIEAVGPSSFVIDTEGLSTDTTVLISGRSGRYDTALSDMIRANGMSPVFSRRGETTLFLAEFYRPVLIVLDINHPDRSGWEALNRLKMHSGIKDIPVFYDFPQEDGNADPVRVSYCYQDCRAIGLPPGGGTVAGLKAIAFKHATSQYCRKKEDLQDHQGQIDLVDDSAQALQQIMDGSVDVFFLEEDDVHFGMIDFFSQLSVVALKNQLHIVICSKHSRHPAPVGADRVASHSPMSDDDRCLPEPFYTSFACCLDSLKQAPVIRELQQSNCDSGELRNKKIMIVDDDMRSLYALSNILEEASATVVGAVNGEKGLARLMEHPDTDLVVIDTTMPVMDGYEAIRKIREERRFSKLPVIALTESMKQDEISQCLRAGATDYLPKPIDIRKFCSMVSVWL